VQANGLLGDQLKHFVVAGKPFKGAANCQHGDKPKHFVVAGERVVDG